MNLRGRYEGGGCTVTAKHWWSREDRRVARVAALVLAYEVDAHMERVRAAVRDACVEPTGRPLAEAWADLREPADVSTDVPTDPAAP